MRDRTEPQRVLTFKTAPFSTRWRADCVEIPAVMSGGVTQEEALSNAMEQAAVFLKQAVEAVNVIKYTNKTK